MIITTPRLTLLELTTEQLDLMLNAPADLETRLGFPLSRSMLQDPVPRALRMKLERMRLEDPVLHPWSTYWLIVIAQPTFGAGMAGFKGAPDANGSVEIGYGIDPLYQGKGYMTESVRALVQWAFQHPECREVTARGVLKSNLASQHVLVNVGMQLYAGDELTTSWRIRRDFE